MCGRHYDVVCSCGVTNADVGMSSIPLRFGDCVEASSELCMGSWQVSQVSLPSQQEQCRGAHVCLSGKAGRWAGM